jgi:hypothetical protein
LHQRLQEWEVLLILMPLLPLSLPPLLLLVLVLVVVS